MGNRASKSALLMAASHRVFIDAISSENGSAPAGAIQLMTRSRANDTSEMRLTSTSIFEFISGTSAFNLGLSTRRGGGAAHWRHILHKPTIACPCIMIAHPEGVMQNV